ncbi:MAG: SPFH domain-containing protein [archaeon]
MNEVQKKQVIFFVIFIIIVSLIYSAIVYQEILLSNIWILVPVIVVLILLARVDFLILLKDYERAVIFRFGKVSRVGGPGWALIFPLIESFVRVDLRVQTIDMQKQDVVTKDRIELQIDAVIFIAVKKDKQSVINSVVEVQDYKDASRLYVKSSVRDIVGSMDLQGVISGIEDLNVQIKKGLEAISLAWGVRVDGVTIKDVDIPKTVMDAMHLEKAAEQEKLARMQKAKAAKYEIEAVKEASEALSNETISYYYIKALEEMSKGQSTKIIFPIEVLKLAESLSGKTAGALASGVKTSMLKNIDPKLVEKYAPLLQQYLKDLEKKKKKKK